MKVSFTNSNLVTKIKEYKKEQDKRIIQHTQEKWDRKKCNTGLFGLGAVLTSYAVSPALTKHILQKTKANIIPISLEAGISLGIMATGIIAGHLFNKIDEKKNTKLGDFASLLFNGPRSIEKNSSKINVNA